MNAAGRPMTLVLLDRDGVLNEDRSDSVRSPDELVMLPRAAAAGVNDHPVGAASDVIRDAIRRDARRLRQVGDERGEPDGPNEACRNEC